MTNLINLMLFLSCTYLFQTIVCAKQSHQKNRQQLRCQQDECQLRSRHFALYSNIKQALDNNFDINGKDAVSLLRSYDILRIRFGHSNQLNGSDVILNLLDSEKLTNALKVLQSDDGKYLLELYHGSLNGRSENLACSRWRIGEIEQANKVLARDVQLAQVFGKMHKNFVKKSSRKCLKHACTSIDENMSKLDSVLRRSASKRSSASLAGAQATSHDQWTASNEIADPSGTDRLNDDDNNHQSRDETTQTQVEREFNAEETELCRFFRKTNATNCQMSGKQLGELNFMPELDAANKSASVSSDQAAEQIQMFNDHLAAYVTNTNAAANQSEANKLVLTQCRTLSPMLEYNLAGLKWYIKENLIDAQRMASRTFWCPSLSYWLELNRLCQELEAVSRLAAAATKSGDTFAY